jgi:hypothetical protein
VRLAVTDTDITVTLRQSWINDAMTCQERARRMIVNPEASITSDSAAIGTAVHAAIEAAINGNDPEHALADEWDVLLAEPMNMTLGWSPSEMRAESQRLYGMWERDIRPHIGTPRHTEMYFDVPWFTTDVLGRDVNVRLSGTIDLVTDEGLWDWKTSSRKYAAADKQNTAVQPTVYSIAANALELHEMPVTFSYGVMLRGKNETQILRVRRTRNHEVWLARVVEPLIRQALALGTDMTWPVNDTHNLCSQRWCPWWSSCKGQALSPTDLYSKEQN